MVGAIRAVRTLARSFKPILKAVVSRMLRPVSARLAELEYTTKAMAGA